MSYLPTIQHLAENPEALEQTYQRAVKAGEQAAFAEAIEAARAKAPANLLLAAWHYRLIGAAVKKRAIAWGWALPLAALNGLLLWLLSDDRWFMLWSTNPLTGQASTLLPAVVLLAAPISAATIALFLTLAGGRRPGRAAVATLALAAAAAYVLLIFRNVWPRPYQIQYVNLMVMHLALLAWAGVGVVALSRRDGVSGRFAFLVKSLESFITVGLLAIAGGLFAAITAGLFDALGIRLPEVVQRLFIAGGGGLIVVIAVALVYDPAAAPLQQPADEGLSKLVALLMRLLLPLAVAVLVVYLAFIPANWREPFENRGVLLTFNGMLFAVIALLVGATPVHDAELDRRGQVWLRRGAMALAGLAVLVSLYALAAILYRTVNDRLTPNRLVFIGWNVINIAILVVLLIRQARAGQPAWLAAMHRTFALGTVLYVSWALAGLLALPWLFQGRSALTWAAGLPQSIQDVVFDVPPPILLKCVDSPHVYLLDQGQKRWIKDIPTFEAQGYRWNDVLQWISCADLRQVPDGVPIPPDAGPPPMP